MRIDLQTEEIDALTARFEAFKSVAAELDGAETEAAPEWAPPHAEAALRQDEPEEPLSRERALSFAPATEDGYFRVPRTVDDSH